MAMRRFALIILIGFFPGSNAALAADGVEAADVSERKTAVGVSVGMVDLDRSIKVGGQPWRIRRAKNPAGSMMLLRNETGAPFVASFARQDGQEAASEQVPAGGVVVRRCEASGARYPLTIASEQGEGVLDAQLTCGDAVVVQSADRTVAPVETINRAWATPPSESVAEPLDAVGEH